MFKDYWQMSDDELTKLARKYNLRDFFEETVVLTEDRKIDNDFVINRKSVIDQLLQRDTGNMAYRSLVVAIIAILISLASFVYSGFFAPINQQNNLLYENKNPHHRLYSFE